MYGNKETRSARMLHRDTRSTSETVTGVHREAVAADSYTSYTSSPGCSRQVTYNSTAGPDEPVIPGDRSRTEQMMLLRRGKELPWETDNFS